MKAFTPPITAESIVKPSFSRMPSGAAAPRAARLATSSFHSAALLGLAFQFGRRYGAAMSARNSGLTVSGTGMLRPGTVRGPACALAAFCRASIVAKSESSSVWWVATCAIMGEARVAVRTSEMMVGCRKLLILVSPLALVIAGTLSRSAGGDSAYSITNAKCDERREARGALVLSRRAPTRKQKNLSEASIHMHLPLLVFGPPVAPKHNASLNDSCKMLIKSAAN